MRLALVIYKYFPFGGLQRDMLGIALELKSRGHDIRIYCRSWQGEQPRDLDVRTFPASLFSNRVRNEKFQRKVKADLARDSVDAVLGFNKMPGLDIYFAGDACFVEQAQSGRSPLYRRSKRFRHFAADERAVFEASATTRILLLAQTQRGAFSRHYGTADERMVTLPPCVAEDRRAPDNAAERRRNKRAQLNIQDQELTLLFVGSGFRTKGLDRAIRALARMRQEQPSVKARLLVAGQDKMRTYRRLARRQGVGAAIEFLGGCEDVADLMLAADVLIHPARAEAAGVVLLEAVASGLPVVTTDVCGYADHVARARAGYVLPEPFSQERLDKAVMRFIDGVFRADCRESALLYARMTDLHAMPQVAADQIERWLS